MRLCPGKYLLAQVDDGELNMRQASLNKSHRFFPAADNKKSAIVLAITDDFTAGGQARLLVFNDHLYRIVIGVFIREVVF